MKSAEDYLYPFLKNYMSSPQWLKTPLGYLYRRIPHSLRYGTQYTKSRNELLRVAPQNIDSLIERKLSETLAWAAETVPAYSRFRTLIKEKHSARYKLSQFPLMDKN